MTDILTHLQIVRERVENSRVMGSSNEREIAELGKFLLGHSLSTSERSAESQITDYCYALSWHEFIPLALVSHNLLYETNKSSSTSSSNINCNESESNHMSLSHPLPLLLSRQFDKIVSVCASENNNGSNSDKNGSKHGKHNKTSKRSKMDLSSNTLQPNKEEKEEEYLKREEEKEENYHTKFTSCNNFTSCLDEVSSWAESLYYKTRSEQSNNKEMKEPHYCLIVIESSSPSSSSFQQYANKDYRANGSNSNGDSNNFPDAFVNSAVNTLSYNNYSKGRRSNNNNSNTVFGWESTNTAKRFRGNNTNSNNNVHNFLHNLACVSNLCSARSIVSSHDTCHLAVLMVLQEHKLGEEVLCKALQREYGYKYSIRLHAQEDKSTNNNNNSIRWNDMFDMYTHPNTNCTSANNVHSVLYQEIIEAWNPELLLSSIKCNITSNNNLVYPSLTTNTNCNSTNHNFNVSLSQLVRQESNLFFVRPRNWSLSLFFMKSLQMYPLLMTITQLKQCETIWSLRHSLRDVLRAFHLMLTNSYSTEFSTCMNNTNEYNEKKKINKSKHLMERHCCNSQLEKYEDSIKMIEMLLDVSLMLTNQILCNMEEKYNVERNTWPSNETVQSIFFMLLYTELAEYSSSYELPWEEEGKQNYNAELSSERWSKSSFNSHIHDCDHSFRHRLLRFPSIVNSLAELYNSHCGEKHNDANTKLNADTNCSSVIKENSKKTSKIDQYKKQNKKKAIVALCCLLPFTISYKNNDMNDFTNVRPHQHDKSLLRGVVELPHLFIPPDLTTSLGKQLEHTLLTSLIPPHASLSDLRQSEWHTVPYLWEYNVQNGICKTDYNKKGNNDAATVATEVVTMSKSTLRKRTVLNRKNFYSSSVPVFMRMLYLLSVHNVTHKSVSSKDKYISLAKIAAVCMLNNNYEDDEDDRGDDDDLHLLRVLHELQVCGFVDLMRDKDSGEVKIRSLLEELGESIIN